MVLDNYRTTLDWWLVPLAKGLRGVHPDVFTWSSLAVAAVGGVAFWRSGPTHDGLPLLLVAWVCVGVNSVLDLLDGKVAHLTGQATPRGDYLDHAVDRFSDTFFLLGLAFSAWVRVDVGLVALVGTLLTSYMGTQAQAVGLRRDYKGLLGRADRMVLLLVIPLAQWLWTTRHYPVPWFASLLEAMMAYFALMGVLTTVQRFVGGLRGFDAKGQLKP